MQPLKIQKRSLLSPRNIIGTFRRTAVPLRIFPVFLALFGGLAVAAFSLPESGTDPLQGSWFDDDRYIKITFLNGNYEVEMRLEPSSKGEYTVCGNEIVRVRKYVHSSLLDDYRNRWFSKEEAIAEFGSRFDIWLWFEPFTEVFSVDGDILTLTLVSNSTQQRFERVRH